MTEQIAKGAASAKNASVRALIVIDNELRTEHGGRTFIMHEQPEKKDGKILRSLTVICDKVDAEKFKVAFEGADTKVIDYDHWKDAKGPYDYFE